MTATTNPGRVAPRWLLLLAFQIGGLGVAHADPQAGIGVYGGAVAAHQTGIGSLGLGAGVDIQYPIDADWSINPFILFSLERSSGTGYDLLDSLGGVQLRRWVDSSWYAGVSLASHNTTYRLPGTGTANAAGLVSPGLFVGAEFPSGFGLHLQVNDEPTQRPYVDNSGRSSGTQRLSGSLMMTYRWREIAQGEVPVSTEGSSFKLSDLVSVSSSGRTQLLIGLSYGQRTYKARGQAGANSADVTTLTDNGAASPVLDVYGSERIVRTWPLEAGNLAVGWNWTASLGYVDTPYQVTNDGIRGARVGTGVTGGYLALAPLVYVKVGPLSALHPIYASLSMGAGPGLLDAHGTGLFGADPSPATAGTQGTKLGVYTYAKAALEMGHWVYAFTGSGLNVYQGNHPSIQTYGLGVAYRIAW